MWLPRFARSKFNWLLHAGLQVVGQMGNGETVLVTAAAGGTGQFVVQLAKAAGNHVIATCGGADKAALLKQLGADRVINYREESVKDVLKQEYPKVGALSHVGWKQVAGTNKLRVWLSCIAIM